MSITKFLTEFLLRQIWTSPWHRPEINKAEIVLLQALADFSKQWYTMDRQWCSREEPQGKTSESESRYRPRICDQGGHQNTYESIWNRHVFTKSCHIQTYQNYEQSRQKLGIFFRKQSTLKIKVFKKISFWKLISMSNKENKKDFVDFWCWKITLKVWILQALRRSFKCFRDLKVQFTPFKKSFCITQKFF